MPNTQTRWVRLSRTAYSLTPRWVSSNLSWLSPTLLGTIAVVVGLLSSYGQFVFGILLTVCFVLISLWTAALDRAWKDHVSRARQDIAGALGFITERIDRRQGNKSKLSKDVFVAELCHQQTRLLDLARREIAEEARLPIESVWANWCTECGADPEHREFQVQFFHGDGHGRTPGSTHPINDTLPGAAKAFSTTRVALVKDTTDPTVRESFNQSRPYRCILSVPVRVAAEGQEWVVGVTNFDSVVPDSFSTSMHRVVADFVYLIGLCEGLKRWA